MKLIKDYWIITIRNLKTIGPIFLVIGSFLLLCYFLKIDTCPFKYIFGVPCPGCGITRAFIQLFQGHIKAAMLYHPLFPLVPLFAWIFFYQDRPLWKKISRNPLILSFLMVTVFGIYVLRLILLFGNEPMIFQERSIVGLIIKLLK